MKKISIFLSAILCATLSFAKPVVVGLVDVCKTNTLCSVPSTYATAVYEAGAVPYVLPSTTNAASIAALLDRVDMLLFCGGEDFEPSRFGETNHVNLGEVNLRRDAWEFALADEAIRRRIPLLGICRGCQFINIRFGGTLWQDLPSEKEGAKVHRLEGEHESAFMSGTYLHKLVGPMITVNSRHHQAVKDVAKGFKISAVSPDGVIEAIEGTDYPAVGVQFHPELLFTQRKRIEFLPLFRGDFTTIDSAKRAVAPRRKLVAIPDYCATNRQVVAKSNLAAALEEAGFVAVVIPFHFDDAKLEAALADADALMIGGAISKLQNYQKRCDFEHRAIRIALKRDIPISGVCHGAQVINTFFEGGTLSKTPQAAKPSKKPLIYHRMPTSRPYVDNFHLIDLEPGSRIARALGSNRAVVNSSHSVRTLKPGIGLKVTARAPDGVIEALEHEDLPVMAFQFHPERMTYDARFIELLRIALSPIAP